MFITSGGDTLKGLRPASGGDTLKGQRIFMNSHPYGKIKIDREGEVLHAEFYPHESPVAEWPTFFKPYGANGKKPGFAGYVVYRGPYGVGDWDKLYKLALIYRDELIEKNEWPLLLEKIG